jgi:regulatory protein
MGRIQKPTAEQPPNTIELRGAALAHLARFSATESSLARILLRKVDRWQACTGVDPERAAQLADVARASVASIVKQLAASGAVSDAQFAETRARAMVRSGRSRRAAGAYLLARGVAPELAKAALPDDAAQELAAALIHARKRRLGPWRQDEALPEKLRRELGSLARAGFSHSVAARALRLDRDEAEALISAFRAAL